MIEETADPRGTGLSVQSRQPMVHQSIRDQRVPNRKINLMSNHFSSTRRQEIAPRLAALRALNSADQGDDLLSTQTSSSHPSVVRPVRQPQGRLFRNTMPSVEQSPTTCFVGLEQLRRNIELSRETSRKFKFEFVVLEDFTVVSSRNVRSHDYDPWEGGHAFLAGGQDVRFAGSLDCFKGEVRVIRNDSGHYQPNLTLDEARETLSFLEGWGPEIKYIHRTGSAKPSDVAVNLGILFP
jgi:hypothetical protein